MWDIRQKKRLYTVQHNSYVYQVQVFAAGSRFDLISCSFKDNVKVWRDEKLVKTLVHSDFCYGFHLNSEKTMLAVAHYKGVTVWSTADWKKLADLEIGVIMGVNFNSVSTKIIAAHNNGQLSVIDLE